MIYISFQPGNKEIFLPSPMIVPAPIPDNNIQGPLLEPFHKVALTPKHMILPWPSILSNVPGAKLLIDSFVTLSRYL